MRPTALTSVVSLAALSLAVAACNSRPKDTSVHPEPTVTPSDAPVPTAEGVLRLGAAIESSAEKVSLADIAKNPTAFVGKKFATTGTVTAVCEHMGCWMEIKDESGEAHIKMAGHAFFVPKTSAGRKARVLATLVTNDDEAPCGDHGEDTMAAAGFAAAGEKHAKGKGCKAEAEAHLGRPLAKLELVAEGVELM